MLITPIDSQKVADKTTEMKASLAQIQPGADFVEYAAGVIYDRLKNNIGHYRQYGPYWWALKDVLRRQDYNVGDETDSEIVSRFKGRDDAQTLVAADMFYEDTSRLYSSNNMDWPIEYNKPDYRLFDEDMELRPSITSPTSQF